MIFIDVWRTYLLPAVCFCSVLASVLNICVLGPLQSRGNTLFVLMLWSSVAYLLYSLTSLFVFVVTAINKDGRNSTAIDYSHFNDTSAFVSDDWYDVDAYFYVATSLRLFITLVELWIVFERLAIFKSKATCFSTIKR